MRVCAMRFGGHVEARPDADGTRPGRDTLPALRPPRAKNSGQCHFAAAVRPCPARHAPCSWAQGVVASRPQGARRAPPCQPEPASLRTAAAPSVTACTRSALTAAPSACRRGWSGSEPPIQARTGAAHPRYRVADSTTPSRKKPRHGFVAFGQRRPGTTATCKKLP